MAALFAAPLARMPFTHLGRIAHPATRTLGGLRGPWHYWWQAHYLDAIVDAGLRDLRRGDRQGAGQHARAGDRLLRTIRLRNRLRWTNDFYDDMAWLALATGRLASLHASLADPSGHRRLRSSERALTAALRSAISDDLGGGLFWSTTRDFKNVPATGPAALHLARTGDTETARRLLDWLYARLLDPVSGLFQDGIRIIREPTVAESVVADVWSYNQGTVLGTLVTLGDDTSRSRAADLIAAVDDRLTTRQGEARILRTHGGGDGGLFSGILARYLALAARTPGLDERARATATRLVRDTASAFWHGRDTRALATHRRGGSVAVFSPDPARSAEVAAPRGAAVELSTQLQAWTVLEAAAILP